MKSALPALALIVAAIVGVMFVQRFFMGGVAPTPPYFDTSRTLDDALERSKSSGKPVLALVTADWCPPCQALKRGALVDERVADFIESSTEPAYITDQQRHDVQRLGVSAFPTSVVIRDGEVVASLRGGASAGAYLEWLKTNAAAPTADASP